MKGNKDWSCKPATSKIDFDFNPSGIKKEFMYNYHPKKRVDRFMIEKRKFICHTCIDDFDLTIKKYKSPYIYQNDIYQHAKFLLEKTENLQAILKEKKKKLKSICDQKEMTESNQFQLVFTNSSKTLIEAFITDENTIWQLIQ